MLDWIGDLGSTLFDAGKSLIGGLFDGIMAAGEFIGDIGKKVANAVIGFINDNVINAINAAVKFEIAGFEIDPPDIPHIPTFHSGGVFRPRGATEGLALLRSGEGIFTPDQMDALGTLGAGDTTWVIEARDRGMQQLLEQLIKGIRRVDRRSR